MRRQVMKTTVIERVLARLSGFEKAGKAVEALEAVQAGDQPGESEAAEKEAFDPVPAVAHRPDLPDQAMTFDGETGLPHVAMDRFPLPHDEDEDVEADIFV
jgi:hypothetical protein